jgi:uncharacterized protein (AIM24 family)
MHAEWKFDVGFASNGRRSVQRLQLGRRFSVQDDSALAFESSATLALQ